MKTKELPIGTKIELPFITLEVVEEDELDEDVCKNCFFDQVCMGILNTTYRGNLVGECRSSHRSDGKDVYFKSERKRNSPQEEDRETIIRLSIANMLMEEGLDD